MGNAESAMDDGEEYFSQNTIGTYRPNTIFIEIGRDANIDTLQENEEDENNEKGKRKVRLRQWRQRLTRMNVSTIYIISSHSLVQVCSRTINQNPKVV